MASYDDLIPNKSNKKLVNYKDYLSGKSKGNYSDLIPKNQPKKESGATKAFKTAQEFLLPSRGFDITPKNTMTTKSGKKIEVPDVIGKNFSKLSTKDKLIGAGRYAAEAAALPEALGNLVLTGVSKLTGVGKVEDSALQKKLIDLATPKTKNQAEAMRALDVIGYLTGAGAGKKTAETVIDTVAKNKKTKLPIKTDPPIESIIKVGTPKTRQSDYAKRMGYEPIIPDADLPVIDAGPRAKDTSGLPVIRAGVPTPRPVKGDITYEPIRDIIENGRNAEAFKVPATTQPTKLEGLQTRIPEPETTIITPKLSSDIETEAIAQGVARKFEDIPEIPKMNMKQGIDNAAKIVADDFDKAKRIALGDESVPQGTEIGMVYEAVKQKALKDNNWELLRELATNPNAAPTQATRAGQIVKSFDTLNDSVDPVELMQKVVNSRKEGVSVLKKADIARSKQLVKEEIKKARPTRNDWVEFINNIEC